MLPIELTNADIRNSEAYKEYYAIATRATPPKTKASVWKTKSSSDTIVTPPLTAAAGTRLFTSAKGKQPTKASKAKSLTALSEVAMTEAEQLKLATKRSLQQTHISQASGSGADEGTEETKDKESFDPIPKSPENTNDKGNGEANLRLNVGREEGQDEEDDEDELYRDSSFVSSQFVTSMLNPTPDAGIESIYETTSQMDVQAPTLSDRLRDEAQADNEEFLKNLDENIQKIIKEQVKEQVKVQVSKILSRIEQTMNEQLEVEVFTRSSNSSKTSYAVATDLSKMELKKILIEKIEGNKSIHRSNEQRNLYKALVEAYESDKIILDTYGDTIMLKRCRDDDADKDKEPSAGSDRGSKRRREGKEPESTTKEPMQTTHEMEEPSHPEFETGADDQPIAEPSQHPEWFSQQKKPPTPDRDWNKTLPATYGSIQPWISELEKQTDSRSSFNELMDTPGSCKSLEELKFFLEEVYKATTDQLDWVNPEGQQYPHNLLKPLPLISNFRGRRVILFDHFINNDLAYLCGGASSRKYTTYVTKTKAADYGHIKWIKDLVPQTMESAHDVYSKRRIIAVTELKIVEWYNYKHLDWITVRRDDDKLYKFKEGDFKRLRIQDIEDIMFTRSIVIQRCVEDLQHGVESYQKKLNLTRPDTYRSDLKRKEAYTAYSNPKGFIYQNKDKQNRLMRIDELHKFSDGTLTDVRTALDDRLKGIQMKYLPQTIWRRSDKERAATMIQAIDKQLKTRRIMRSLERFVGGRLYEGDFRMLQRTI
nr:hypothetical protein [Tanacetum cinerariifolium]